MDASKISDESAGDPLPQAIPPVLRQHPAAAGGGDGVGGGGNGALATVKPAGVAAVAGHGATRRPARQKTPPEVGGFSAESNVKM